MGINSSKSTKKASNSFSGISPNNSLKSEESNKSYTNILVLSRMGSMFFDEDGDLAHEFYIEVPPPKKGCKATMKRVLHNLIPQGEVPYKFPRLHCDFPVILHHV
ncbi:tumor suppressor candidate 2-like isoform X2 [Schistocerca piceifrons]|uniref:tumor suppressor candidate 2-like n=1 Tax=Schistocerca cancellata TaxID=274614 RepID=UPI001F5EDAEF|nr:tumor suppressor candidate 2-like isoform X2 [Schistocerca piceifrons]XP_049782685.1 tumor suppressor candidate 2-like [Schistocerca cancellata]